MPSFSFSTGGTFWKYSKVELVETFWKEEINHTVIYPGDSDMPSQIVLSLPVLITIIPIPFNEVVVTVPQESRKK